MTLLTSSPGSYQADSSFTQLCRREASEASIFDSAMKGDAEDPAAPEIGRAASWATKIERLLSDMLGVAMFRDFLQKEFRYAKLCSQIRVLHSFVSSFSILFQKPL